MWQYHTRTWVANGAFHQTVNIGLGWYLILLAIIVVLVALFLSKEL